MVGWLGMLLSVVSLLEEKEIIISASFFLASTAIVALAEIVPLLQKNNKVE